MAASVVKCEFELGLVGSRSFPDIIPVEGTVLTFLSGMKRSFIETYLRPVFYGKTFGWADSNFL